METPSPPPKTRMKALFAIVAIALLLLGLGAGYLLGRPVPAAIPGPVSGLLRTMIPRVDGWFRNASVSYHADSIGPRGLSVVRRNRSPSLVSAPRRSRPATTAS